MRHLVARGPLAGRVEIDSAGTHAYHIGSTPDPRSVEHAAKRGIDLTPLRARKIEKTDFAHFDHVLAMDANNIERLREICPARHASRIQLLMDFAERGAGLEVPDPYYGDTADFEQVLDLVEEACVRLHNELLRRFSLAASASDNPQRSGS